MKPVLTLTLAAAVAMTMTTAEAKPHLREIKEIDNALMYVGIADKLRKECSGINARMIKALSHLNGLKRKARKMGYSDTEIEDYVTSKSEKARMRKKATKYLRTKGVNPGDKSGFCAYGRDQIAKGTPIGSLLKAK